MLDCASLVPVFNRFWFCSDRNSAKLFLNRFDFSCKRFRANSCCAFSWDSTSPLADSSTGKFWVLLVTSSTSGNCGAVSGSWFPAGNVACTGRSLTSCGERTEFLSGVLVGEISWDAVSWLLILLLAICHLASSSGACETTVGSNMAEFANAPAAKTVGDSNLVAANFISVSEAADIVEVAF